MGERPNVLLIMVDQWRGDCLSIDDHPVVHTPYLDTLALQGARFDRAYTATPTCIPARAALYTGTKQTTHGRVGYLDGVPWDYPVTMAGEFTRHGYQTQAIGKMHVYPERSQIGFQNVILHDGFINHPRAYHHNYDLIDDYIPWLRERYRADTDFFGHGVHCNSIVARPWDKPEDLHPTNFIAEQAVGFIKKRDTRKPFFLYLSFHRPHPPYDPPEWAFDEYMDMDMPDVPVGNWTKHWEAYANPKSHDCPVGELPAYLHKRARAGYYGHMSHIDQQINRVVWTLKEYGLLDNTYICFVSDHGEMMGDHNMFRKGFPYEGSARVPLILVGPKGSEIAANQQHSPVIELRDIMPTLLDCAGLPIPESVEGRSFLPYAEGGEAQDWREYLHGEHILWGQSIQWLTDGHEKYVWMSSSGVEQLFNLDDDPDELNDLVLTGDGGERITLWRSRMIAELAGREEGFVQDGQLVVGRPVHPCLSHLRKQAGLDQDAHSDWHNRGVI
ncbi:MAG TPA: arylsulfatase [Anaerolineales bacterium]|nr:arylsulfatase [Anaerolineales bacterium]